MFALELLKVIGELRSLARLDAVAKDIWSAWGSGALTDEQAQSLAEAVTARKSTVRGDDTVKTRMPGLVVSGAPGRLGEGGGLSTTGYAGTATALRNSIFPPKRRPKSPDRQRSIARRRRLAASGPLPPQIAARFTTGQLAVLRIIADEVESRRGTCAITIGEIAARAGVCIALARNAIRNAERLFLITTEFRKRAGRPHLPSVIRIISKEWNAWLIIGGRVKRAGINAEREDGTLPFRLRAGQKGAHTFSNIGSKKIGPTGTDPKGSTSLLSGQPQSEAAQRPYGRPLAVA
jgi:hypothetical protein